VQWRFNDPENHTDITGYQERMTPYGRRKLHYTQKTSKKTT
jgi:hypothetical protein